MKCYVLHLGVVGNCIQRDSILLFFVKQQQQQQQQHSYTHLSLLKFTRSTKHVFAYLSQLKQHPQTYNCGCWREEECIMSGVPISGKLTHFCQTFNLGKEALSMYS